MGNLLLFMIGTTLALNVHAQSTPNHDQAPKTSLVRKKSAMKNYIQATIRAKKIDDKFIVDLTLHNKGVENAYLWNIFFPINGQLKQDSFDITCDGKEIDYTHPMIKRGPPKDTDFIEIKPGSAYSSAFAISDFYDFPKGIVHCSLRYSVYNPSKNGKGHSKIESNTIEMAVSL
ncbi:hypothetical protein HZU77_016060 [Neisseriaceae bacterium TC5R-5]|nr:hypothetical protein [Neisseriaceae bacterium TC5R-5]